MKALLAGSGLFVWAAILIIVVSLAGTLLYYAVLPHFINLERSAVQHTNPYLQSKVTELVQSYDKYQELETQKLLYQNDPDLVASYGAQQKALVRRMCQAANLVPSDIRATIIPMYIQDFLRGENCHV